MYAWGGPGGVRGTRGGARALTAHRVARGGGFWAWTLYNSTHFFFLAGSGGSNAASMASSNTFFNPFCKTRTPGVIIRPVTLAVIDSVISVTIYYRLYQVESLHATFTKLFMVRFLPESTAWCELVPHLK